MRAHALGRGGDTAGVKTGRKTDRRGYIIGLKRKCRSRILSRIAGSSPPCPSINLLPFVRYFPFPSLPFFPRWRKNHRLDDGIIAGQPFQPVEKKPFSVSLERRDPIFGKIKKGARPRLRPSGVHCFLSLLSLFVSFSIRSTRETRWTREGKRRRREKEGVK